MEKINRQLISPKEDLSNVNVLLDYGIDLKNRTIYLDDEVNLNSGTEFYRKVNYIYQTSKDEKSPITLIISTLGGDSFGTLGLIDQMENLPTLVNTHCVGCAFSAGSIILAGGTGLRTMTNNSLVMVHGAKYTDDPEISVAQRKIVNNVTNLLNERMCAILEKKSNQKATFWQKTFKNNLYLTAEEALKYGLIDKIV